MSKNVWDKLPKYTRIEIDQKFNTNQLITNDVKWICCKRSFYEKCVIPTNHEPML